MSVFWSLIWHADCSNTIDCLKFDYICMVWYFNQIAHHKEIKYICHMFVRCFFVVVERIVASCFLHKQIDKKWNIQECHYRINCVDIKITQNESICSHLLIIF